MVSAVKISLVSLMPFAACVFVSAPLMPLVAFVELPPQKEDLSTKTTLPPHSRTVLAADTPAKPPPTTIAWFAGNTIAMAPKEVQVVTGGR